MSLHNPPSYKQLDRETGKWKTITPAPVNILENRRPTIKFYCDKETAEKMIFQAFQKSENGLAAFELLKHTEMNSSSIRVWISRLVKKGLLIKTTEVIKNAFNRPCFKYKLKDDGK